MRTHNAVRSLKLFLVAVLLSAAGVETASAVVSGDISRMFNARWTYDFDGTNKYLSYGEQDNSFTKLAGSFANQKIGLALGLNVNINADDNAISKADRMMGYLGYKRTYLRYQRGSMNGTFRWQGAVTPSMARSGKFEKNLTHIDLLLREKSVIGFIGLGYTTFEMPVEVQTLYTGSDKAHQKNGTFVYDPDFSANFYSFLFGFDTFNEALATPEGAKNRGSGFGMFISGEDRFGIGSSTLSKQAVANAMALNPGLKPTTESFVAVIVENDTNIGIRWFSPSGNIRIGVGYEVSFISNFNFNGAAEKPGDLGFDVYASTLRYGPIARFMAKW